MPSVALVGPTLGSSRRTDQLLRQKTGNNPPKSSDFNIALEQATYLET